MNVVPLPTLTFRARAVIDPPLCPRPVGAVRARLGFPSPAQDFEDDQLDLNQLLVRNPPATFFYRTEGRSMEAFGIFHGDIVSVDRSLEPSDGALVVAIWDDNGPACKQLRVRGDGIELRSGAGAEPPIVLTGETSVEAYVITGVVRVLVTGNPPRGRTRRNARA
ncbi:MAG: peptidase S24 [Rhodanobacteraceae bacterium]|nr:MAG: peptidase S24 [Rhodanobacteraceae bacterium]